MKQTIIAIGSSLLFTSFFTIADYRSSVDEDGCWDARDRYGNSCVTASNIRWSKHTKDKLLVDYINSCDQRVYFTYKIESQSSDGKGAQGIRGNSSTTEYSYNATGRYGYEGLVGSVKPSKDWVCRSKYHG